MIKGQRHLISCRCILPQFKSKQDPPVHKFVVFSTIDENDVAIPKFVQCNNCGIIHKITDICRSEILSGKENMSSIVTLEDIKVSLPSNLRDILERHNTDISGWEQAQFVLENKSWGEFVLLAQDEESGSKQGKYVRIMSETFFKIESFTRQDVV